MPSRPARRVRPDDLVAEARRWLGTPFRHQGRVRGEGVDCVGLILEPARALGLTEYRTGAYARHPDAGTLRRELARHLPAVPRAAMRPGDILVLAAPLSPCHLALVGEQGGRLTMIHASGPVGRVVEHGIDPTWDARVRGVFRFPDLADQNARRSLPTRLGGGSASSATDRREPSAGVGAPARPVDPSAVADSSDASRPRTLKTRVGGAVLRLPDCSPRPLVGGGEASRPAHQAPSGTTKGRRERRREPEAG